MNFLKTTEFKLFITIFLVLSFYISHYGGSHMADSMLSTTQAIIDHGSIQIDSYAKEVCKDPSKTESYGCDHAFYNGHWYSGFAPGASIIVIPAYLILKPFTYFIPDIFYGYSKFQIKTILLNIFATLLIIIPLSALLSVLIYKFTRKFIKNKKYRIATSLLFSFATLFFWYSTEYDTRILAAFFSLTAFYFIFKNRIIQEPKQLFIAGLFSSIAITIEYTQIIVSAILFLYAISLLRNKKIIYYLIGATIPILLMLLYHYVAFDDPFSTGYDLRTHDISAIASKENLFNSFSFSKLWTYTFSPKAGLFFYMPILFLSIYGLYIGFKEKRKYWREWLVIILVSLSYLLFLCLSNLGYFWTFGPRYLMPIIPFLFIALPLAMNKIKLGIVLIFGGVSFLINYLPVLYLVEHVNFTPGFPVFKEFIVQIPKKGLTSYTFNLINQEIIPLNYTFVNIANIIILGILGVIIWRVWKY